MKLKPLVTVSLVTTLIGLASCTSIAPATQSSGFQAIVEPKNPPIRVTLNKIGVHHNGESGLRAAVPGKPLGSDITVPGEIYLYVVVTDGNATTSIRLPGKEGEYYLLKPDETISLNKMLLHTSEVSDSLSITVIGYEADGGDFEQIVYQALGMAIESYANAQGILDNFNLNLGDLIAKFAGTEHDFMGSYERTFTKSDNWGVGTYSDIPCKVDGVVCLRLWFTIDSPE